MPLEGGVKVVGLKVCLFGAFQVWRGQDLIERHEWDRQKTRSLLKLLLTDPGRAFSHDEIIEALWPGADFDASERSLRVTVSLLRRVLEPELARGTASRYIVQRRPGYAFNREADCWVDTWEFERLQVQANKAREVGKLEEAASGYKTALALVQGEVLAEDPYEAWAMEAKEAWQERQLAALSALAECQALQGLYSEAIHACQQALILDAYREDMYRQLMLYHSYTGEQALALQVYRRYGKLMQEEFGTAPSPEIEQLRVQIETREVPRVDTRRHYPVSERPLKLPYSLSQIQFGGRDREFSFLAARLQAAMKNMGGAVIIEGEAGVGKTRLVEEFLDHARSHGARVLAGRCFERELDPPLEPLLTALDPLLAKEPLLPKALRRDGQELAYLPGGKPYDSSHVYQTLTGSVLREARREKALVLFVDDLQWADPATLEFLAYVAKRVQSEPVLLVVTYRWEDVADLAPWLDHLAERRACTRLSLGRLMPQETAELLKGMTSEDFSELALLAGFLHEESEGNPFYAVEYLRWLLEAGVVESDTQGHIQALKSERLRQAVVPSGVHSLIQARLRSLDGEAKALLNLAAVIGRTFELELICRAVNREEAEAFGILKPLIDKGLITETPGEVYGFSHDKLRHALYEGIGSPQRRALHLKVAGVLAEAGAEPAELAHHYLRARVWQEALENLERAARKAEEAYAWDSALQIYVRALEVATKLPDCEAERFELLGAQERLLERLHHREERAKAVAEMFALAKRLGDRARLAEVQIRRIGILPPEAAVQAGQEAARLFRERGDEAGEARAHRELAYVLWTGGNYAGSLEANFRSLDIHRKLGDLQGEAGDVGNIAQVYLSLGNLDEALSWAEEAVRMYQELGDKVGEALRKFVVADVHRERGDLEAALRLTLQVLHLETELGVKHFVVAQHNYGGTLQLALGVPEQALENFRAAAQLSREIGSTKEEGNAWIGVGISLEKLGDFAGAAAAYRQAVELLEAAYKVSGHVEELSAQADALSALAKLLHHALDQPQEALDSYQAATEIIRELGDDARLRKLLLGLAGLSWRMGRLEDSARGYEEALGLARAHEDTVHEAAALASLGVVYRDLNKVKEAIRCGRKALSLLQDLKDLQAEAYVLSSLAESYQRIGQSSSALTCLRRSLRLRREIGDKEGEVGVLNDLSKIYESLGDEGRAQSFSKKATWKSQALSVCSAERIG